MVLLVLAGSAGGAFTFVALLSHGWLIALVAAPFGGSAAALAAACIVAFRRKIRNVADLRPAA